MLGSSPIKHTTPHELQWMKYPSISTVSLAVPKLWHPVYLMWLHLSRDAN